jgi:hypothetical protein
MKCKKCKHWNNKQAELEYSTFSGICTCHKLQFNTSDDDLIAILDRENRSHKFRGVNHFESQSDVVPHGEVTKSRYCLVTDDSFGCIHFCKNE